MTGSLKNYEHWLQHDGKKVFIKGSPYRLQCKTIHRVYPISETVVEVVAKPINKNSRYYQEVKSQLGDDWVTDVLESIELQSSILMQLGVFQE